jgi:hypothetical protein
LDGLKLADRGRNSPARQSSAEVAQRVKYAPP